MLILAAGLTLRVAAALSVAVAILGSEYVALLGFEGEALDTRAPVVAAALLAVAELGYWSLELRRPVADEAGTSLRRLGLLAGLLVGVVALGVVLLVLVEAVSAGGPAIDLLGAAAAIGALALLALAARRGGAQLASGSGGCIDTPGTGRGFGFGAGLRSGPSTGNSGVSGISSGKTDSSASPASRRSN